MSKFRDGRVFQKLRGERVNSHKADADPTAPGCLTSSDEDYFFCEENVDATRTEKMNVSGSCSYQ